MSEITVTHEPLTYALGTPTSYFRDLALAQAGQGGAADAWARLSRHCDELLVELPLREQRARAAAETAGLELRVNPNTDGPSSTFAPPLWLLDRFATMPRPGRVLASFIPRFTLPAGVQSVNLPRLTTGEQDEAEQDLEAVADADITDTPVTSQVVTITGEGDVALQLLEQSPAGAHLDAAIFADLRGSYAASLETMLVAGAGAAGQLLGLLNAVAASNQIVYNDASPTGKAMFPFFGQMAAAVGNHRGLPPQAWLMRTSRWGWLGTSEDGQGLPLSVPGHMPPPETPFLFDDAHPSPVAPILGWPNYCDDAIPATLAGGQDAVLCCRPSDMLLLESEPRASVMLETLSGTLQARLQMRTYVASFAGRYPSGIATLTGTGLAIQAGF